MNEKKIQESNSENVSFRREIGVFGGISIIGGIMIGSGIFYLGSYVLMRTEMSMGLALLCWIVGGVVSILGGLCFAELGTSSPESGGMVVYLDKAYHPIVGYMFGFTSWILSGSGSISAIAIALPTALRGYIDISDTGIKIIAIALIVGLTFYNCLGIKQGTILQNISMIAKLIPIVAIILAALFMGRENVDLSLTPTSGNSSFGGVIGTIAFATVATLWAYEGWTNLNPVTEEMKNPNKNLPRALILGIGGVTVIYTLFNFAVYKVLPFTKIQEMIDSENLYLGTEVAKLVFGNIGGIVVLATMIVSMFGAINGMIIAFPRYYYAMSKEGHFFEKIGELHPKYKVPTNALISQAIIAVILVLLRNLDQLTALVVFVGMAFNALCVLAVVIYRKKWPDLNRPYKAWGYPLTVWITILLFLGLMINTFIEDPITAIIGLVVPAVGAVVYIIFDRRITRDNRVK